MIEAESHYYRVEMPKVRQKIAEFKEEIGAWGKCHRLNYLYDRLIELETELIDRQMQYQESVEQNGPYIERGLIASCIPEIQKEIAKLEREISFIVKGAEQKYDGISPEMIEQAREYPIENLIEVKRGIALCPFHDDEHPSMGIKNNRFHCFACSAKGDVIRFIMERDGLSFREAVKRLV